MPIELFLLSADLIFVATFLFALFGSRFSKDSKLVLFNAVVICLALLVAFRPLGIGADDFNYLRMVEDAKSIPLSELLDIYERDQIYFTVIRLLSQPFGVRSLMILAAMVLVIKLIYIRRMVADPLMALFTYFCLSFFLHDIIQLRASLAILFMVISVYYLQRSKRVTALTYGIAAGFSHYSGYLVFSLFKPIRASRIFYFLPCVVVAMSLVGFPGLSVGLVSSYVPEIVYISRYLESENRLVAGSFNSANILFYAGLAVASHKITREWVSGVGIAAVNFSALSVLFFKEIVTFAVRFNELFLTFSVFVTGSYVSKRPDLFRAILLVTVSSYYFRWRWIGLISEHAL